jgi:hypothetical protein
MAIFSKKLKSSSYEQKLRKAFGTGGLDFSRSMNHFDRWASPIAILLLIIWVIFAARYNGDLGLTIHFTWLIAGSAIWLTKKLIDSNKEIKHAKKRQVDFESYISNNLTNNEYLHFQADDQGIQVVYDNGGGVREELFLYDDLYSFQWVGDTVGVCFKLINSKGEMLLVPSGVFEKTEQYNTVFNHLRTSLNF